MNQQDDTPAMLAIRDRLQRGFDMQEDEATKLAVGIYFEGFRVKDFDRDRDLLPMLVREHKGDVYGAILDAKAAIATFEGEWITKGPHAESVPRARENLVKVKDALETCRKALEAFEQNGKAPVPAVQP